MPKKLFITDQRMLLLMKWAIEKGKARNQTHYCELIQFPHTGIPNIRRGHQSFTKQQILRAIIFTGSSADYIFGLTNTVKRSGSKSAMEMLKEAVMAVEGEIISRS